MFKYWPAAILGLYIMLMLLLTVSLVMAYSDGIKITQIFQPTVKVTEIEPVELKEVKEAKEIEVRVMEDEESFPLPTRNPVIKRNREVVKRKPSVIKRKKKKTYARKKSCRQGALDKLIGTCYDSKGLIHFVPAK